VGRIDLREVDEPQALGRVAAGRSDKYNNDLFLGWVLWVLGLIFFAVGMSKRPKGLAIAGLVISLVGLIFLLVVFAAIGIAMHV
jgi:hypothetical protein